jgi:TolB-like protein
MTGSRGWIVTVGLHGCRHAVEEIITALSRIRWLFVIARNSSFTYKGQAIGRRVQASHAPVAFHICRKQP